MFSCWSRLGVLDRNLRLQGKLEPLEWQDLYGCPITGELNAYLHIPFCTSICNYCDFTSFAGQESKIAAYVDALCSEIEGSSLEGPLRTVYFGGGTPSLLPPEKLERILRALEGKAGFDPSVEISMEANPETVDGKG